MAIHKLSALKVERTRKPGRYGDGGGLWLHVAATGNKSWVLRYMLAGRAREMGLGSVSLVSLEEAREASRAARRLAKAGTDPIDARQHERARKALETARGRTFKDCAESYIVAHRDSWKNDKHAAQWPATLETYVYPAIGALPVEGVDTPLVLKCLEPIWSVKPETAGRVRGRIELVLDWATARGYRWGDNPARWRGHLDKLLPAKSRVRTVKHHAALPYAEMPAFMGALRAMEGVSPRALEWAILTAARTTETVEARRAEIHRDKALWIIPAERMKGNREHRVPLSARALEIFDDMPSEGEFLFPGGKANRPLSNMALLATLKRMGRGDLTGHGFRSTFRDWAAEQTAFPNEVAEMALAHAVGDKVEAAYRRGDLFAKRRKLMDAWAGYCYSPARKGDVTPIRGRA